MAQVRYTRNLFLRGICIIYLFAFLSFYVQIPGLYGDNGILPARTELDLKARGPLLNKLKQKPSFLWFAPYLGLNVEYMLDVLSLIGIILSFAGFISQRFCIAPIFAGLWSLYYSLYQIGQTFMFFQWDVLLLEVGFLCIIVAPFWYPYRGKSSTPSDVVTFWTVRWLLFRLMFASGVVKLTSGCPVWWKLDGKMILTEFNVPYSTLHQSHNSTIPIQLRQIHAKVDHLHLVNSYGLFRRMTGIDGRPEVIIEGSDSIEGPWKEYEFLYKPGNVNNSLPFVAPHQPRLDWQMWFAALGTYNQNPWLMSLAYRLLSGQPEVLALLNTVEKPFPDRPPKYIKASLYHYHYTPWSQISKTHAWWTRERIGEYFPIFSQAHPPLIEYLTKMKILQEKPGFKITNEPFKLILDNLRSLVRKIESSLLLWSVFTAGCVVIITGYNSSVSKKK
ncbi:lipase maturation factor 2-like [Pogonomyrmex barbatus]|uniref:Lipase maturation factor n=1 Tax=Pogonomyrmex barbatus TaxID=144034 RepID=A0A6I9VYN0_9HYME|nr:lipase maturation factor 2-like [Pogonomyrmex barbatus]